jgi:hypothetical protein
MSLVEVEVKPGEVGFEFECQCWVCNQAVREYAWQCWCNNNVNACGVFIYMLLGKSSWNQEMWTVFMDIRLLFNEVFSSWGMFDYICDSLHRLMSVCIADFNASGMFVYMSPGKLVDYIYGDKLLFQWKIQLLRHNLSHVRLNFPVSRGFEFEHKCWDCNMMYDSLHAPMSVTQWRFLRLVYVHLYITRGVGLSSWTQFSMVHHRYVWWAFVWGVQYLYRV